MINNYVLVNQKLAFAKIILGLLNHDIENHRLDQQALLEAAVAHLYTAYRHYFYEILEACNVPVVLPITTEAELLARLADAEKISAEANELVALSREKQSWLAQLLGQYARLWEPAKPQIKLSPVANDQLISVVALPEDDIAPISTSDVQIWYEALTGIIARHRESGAEF